MIVFAALDLRGGRAVQLVGGSPDDERVSRGDPVRVAEEWAEFGFDGLHIVDLDAALGGGRNDAVVADLLGSKRILTQVGGGVRSDARIEELLRRGVDRVVVGTRAIEDPVWRRAAADRHPQRLVIAADVRGDRITTRGWTRATSLTIDEFLSELADEPLAGILVTDVDREGRMDGVNARKFASICRAASHPVIASGGVRDASDLRTLREVGAAGVVVGMALYTNGIRPEDLIELR